MNITQSILYIFPTLEFWIDFIVEDNWDWATLTWLNKNISQPTQAELEAAWAEVVALEEAKQLKKQKSENIATIASLTDQLNWLWAVCYKLTEWSTDPEILMARKTYEDIQAILNS